MVFQRNWRGDLPEVGQNVYSGRLLAELPDTKELQAEVWILEADAGGVVSGKNAEVRIEGRPDLVLSGKVSRVDALANPRIRGNPVQYFGASLSLAKTDPATMKPGQRVSGIIFLERLVDVLTVPRQAIFDVDGRKSVYRKDRRGWNPVPVTLGANGLGRVVIKDGLEPGDTIALADPTGKSQSPSSGKTEQQKASPAPARAK
jgi:multidrug efflux pump subunit AcrA (membrane-fusion protein)